MKEGSGTPPREQATGDNVVMDKAMLRPLTCCAGVAAAGTIAMAGFYAGSAQSDSAASGIGSCAAHSGLPAAGSDTAGIVFIRRGTLALGSARPRRGVPCA